MLLYIFFLEEACTVWSYYQFVRAVWGWIASTATNIIEKQIEFVVMRLPLLLVLFFASQESGD